MSFEQSKAGTGMEFRAAARVRRRDIDFGTRIVCANGETSEYRTRYVEVTEDWAWSIVSAHAKLLGRNAPLFPTSARTRPWRRITERPRRTVLELR
jgi:hypothetical protein